MAGYIGKFFKACIGLFKLHGVLKNGPLHVFPSMNVESCPEDLRNISFFVCLENNLPNKEPTPLAILILHTALVLHHAVYLLKIFRTFHSCRKKVIIIR